MSTTFYIRKPVKKSDQQEIERLIAKGDLWALKDKLESTLKEYSIGTRSCGWQFGFWGYKEFFHDKESLIEWLKDGQIIDEYGSYHTFEEFWNNEIKDFLYKERLWGEGMDETIVDGLRFIE